MQTIILLLVALSFIALAGSAYRLRRYPAIGRRNRVLRGPLREPEYVWEVAPNAITVDGLTGLVSARALDEATERLLTSDEATQAHPALVVLNLNHFRRLNDDFGHIFGDHVLTIVAKVIAAAASTSGLAARTGGDEFAVLVGDESRADGIRDAIQSGIQALAAVLPTGTAKLSASIAIVRATDAPTVADLHSMAARALDALRRNARSPAESAVAADADPDLHAR